MPHGVNGVKNSGGGVKIIGWGKTPCKSYPTLRVSIVCIEVRTRRVPPSLADTDTESIFQTHSVRIYVLHMEK